jgi:hypothetical protein
MPDVSDVTQGLTSDGLKRRLHTLAQDARACQRHGQYARAEELYAEALALAETSLDKDGLELAGLYNDAGVLYKYSHELSARSIHTPFHEKGITNGVAAA